MDNTPDNKKTIWSNNKLWLSRDIYEAIDGNEIDSLIGDTNLFLRYDPETNEKVAEAEIMIAELSARGKGYGWEAMLLLLKYAQVNLEIRTFEAKIGYDNIKSLHMFEKMHFKEQGRSDIFREITLICAVTPDWISWLDSQVNLNCEKYH